MSGVHSSGQPNTAEKEQRPLFICERNSWSAIPSISLQMSIGPLAVTALVDTGAAISVLSFETLDKLRKQGYQLNLLPWRGGNLTTIGGNALHVIGVVAIPVLISDYCDEESPMTWIECYEENSRRDFIQVQCSTDSSKYPEDYSYSR